MLEVIYEDPDKSNKPDLSREAKTGITKILLNCSYCDKEMRLEEKTARYQKKWYHEQCLEIIKQQEPKTVAPQLEKPMTIKKKAVDPVYIALTVGIFFVLLELAYLTLTFVSVIAIVLASIVTIYQYIVGRRPPDLTIRPRRHGLSVFSATMILLPFIIGTVIAVDGYFTWDSITSSIMVWGLAITFWNTMLFVPLAVHSKYKEAMQKDTKQYPSLSVIIPAYNEEKVIRRTIESIILTRYPQKEVIVVDDGSTDNTLKIATEFKDKVKVLHKKNGGKASALNYGLAFAKGEIIVIVDADTIIGRDSLLEIVKGFRDENVAAVAGNVRIRNTNSWLTKCQALEYISAIQIMRRALDYFGAITIVPGALGAFRKKNLEQAGAYHRDTLVEDFDATIKVLKTGRVVTGSIDAVSFTEAPQTLHDFYKQRKRWYRGNLQVLLRHSDALTNPRFGFLHKLSFPYMILSMLILPAIGIIVWVSAIIAVVMGEWLSVAIFAAHFVALQYLISALAIRIDGSSPKLVVYSIFFIVGYKQLLDVFLIKACLDTLLKQQAVWTSAKRIGTK